MNFYKDINYIAPEKSLKNYTLYDIISKVIEYIKEEDFTVVNAGIWENKITYDNIKWFVTVPAIRNLNQKGIIIKTFEKTPLFIKYNNIYNFFQ